MMVRLRRVSAEQPGWTRRRSGRGFVYLDDHGTRIADPDQIQRLRDLVVPPAWNDVWLCPYPNGHLQAVGTDARGRRQYLYHPQWRLNRDLEKHAHVLDFGRRLPVARQRVAEHLALPGMPRERTLAIAFRMLDLGFFRVGGESYAEENGSYGLATLRKEHVHLQGETVTFEYPAKSGVHRSLVLRDGDLAEALSMLRRRRSGGEELLAWRTGRAWTDLASIDVNQYVKEVVAADVSAKDFRTWHATVLAAITLSKIPAPGSPTAAKRAVTRVVREVSEHLGNTPTVCRASYIDPRVIERFQQGKTILAAVNRRMTATGELPSTGDEVVERAVLQLLRGKG
jgi:DNA topoisomerase-1